MLETTCFCPSCHKLYKAWTHDPAAVQAYPRTTEGYIILDCVDCDGPVINLVATANADSAPFPAWLETLIHQAEPESLNQVVLRTSPMDNLYRQYPHAFADDEPLMDNYEKLFWGGIDPRMTAE